MTDFGPSGATVYERTYSRPQPDGTKETWEDTIQRVATGNLALVHGDDWNTWPDHAKDEFYRLVEHMRDFRIIPAGRHLWASGVKGRQHLMNPVVGTSEVTTRDGVRKIEELVGQTIDVLSMSDNCDMANRQWESTGTWRPATFIYSGEQETYRVLFESGREVISTAEHGWYTKRSRRKLTTLEIEGESIQVMNAPRPDMDADYWIGVMRGVIFGDGWVANGRSMIRVYGDRDGDVRSVFEKFGHKVSLNDKEGFSYIGRLPEHWKSMPSLDESASFWRGFFVGWVAADGHVTKKGAAMLHNRDSHALEYATAGFTKAGVSVQGKPVLCRTTNPFDGSESTLYRLQFNRYSLTADDFIQRRKRERFVATPVRMKGRTDKVVSVEKTGRTEPVYCCLEPATQSWTVNGVLTANCWTSGWGERLSDHMEFTFMRLMEGGGVGANYSSHYLKPFGLPRRSLVVHIVCDPDHPNYEDMLEAGVLSSQYDSDWDGAFEVEDSREGWAAALVDLIDTYMTDDEVKHRNRVYDVSRVRAKGARLKTFGGTASGPQPFARMMLEVANVLNGSQDVRGSDARFPHLTPIEAMEIDHAIAECVVSGGVRRSARMSIVRWDDPFVMNFIRCKSDTGKHWTTNISVEVDDEFFAAGDPYNGHDKFHQAHEVHQAVVAGMLENGEPGYWNSSLSNHGELVPVYATNPCGEITLQPWEACNLGHVNLDAFAPKGSGDSYDQGGLIRAHQLMARFLIRATYADINDPKSRDIQDLNRRIGVGHLGVQGFVVKNGFRYSNIHKRVWFSRLLSELYVTTRNAARKYAFELRIPEPVKVTTVAPTGSIAKLPGVTEGIHPIYARYFEQRIRFSIPDHDQARSVQNYHEQGFEVEQDQYDSSGNTAVVVFPTKNLLVEQVEAMGYPAEMVESADEISLKDMLSIQWMYQKFYADNAVSFTVNVPEGQDHSEVAETIAEYLPNLKGTTIMPDGSRPQAPFTRITEEEYIALSDLSESGIVGDDTDEDCAAGACPVR